MVHNLILCLLSLVVLSQSNCSNQNQNGTPLSPTTEIITGQASTDGVIKLEDYITQQGFENYQKLVLAGGCFWCTEAVFHRINGVVDVVSGYAGGGVDRKPSYAISGEGDFVESITVFYDTTKVSARTLLEVFFVGHDPTTLNSQGPDFGPEYRSAIFYQDEASKQLAEEVIAGVNASGRYPNPVVTTLEPYDLFWTAETYHQNYYELNPNQPYVMRVSRPKVEKIIKEFPSLLKKEYKAK
jgi:peptide-methionine (S)-S-oxide reductase